jgi:hypothetical protein
VPLHVAAGCDDGEKNQAIAGHGVSLLTGERSDALRHPIEQVSIPEWRICDPWPLPRSVSPPERCAGLAIGSLPWLMRRGYCGQGRGIEDGSTSKALKSVGHHFAFNS